MKSTSRSCSRGVSALLVVSLLACPATGRGAAAVPAEPEGALLLRYVSPGVPPALASETGEAFRESLLASVPCRWVFPPHREAPSPRPPRAGGSPAPDLAALAGKIREAASRMERAEAEEAEAILSGAEEEARRAPSSPSLAPYLADIYLRRGVLALWRGDAPAAERRFSAVRTLSPSFRPDPALFSPPVLEAWERSGPLSPLPATLVVDSVPAGAEVRLDGDTAGRTPVRISVFDRETHRLVLLLPGHLPAFADGAWLPGDEPTLSLSLPEDPYASVAGLLPADGEAPPGGLSSLLPAIAGEAGAKRVCLLALSPAGGEGLRGRVLSWTREGGVRDLGFTRAASGTAEGREAGRDAARLLSDAGWPARTAGSEGKPWYHRWWFIAAMGVVVTGAVVALSGGGGEDSSSSGVRVNF